MRSYRINTDRMVNQLVKSADRTSEGTNDVELSPGNETPPKK